MSVVLILACGNPLRGDDAVAWHIAESLADRAAVSNLEIVTAQQLTPELAERVSRADTVVFLDAAAAPPGSVALVSVAATAENTGGMTHHLSPGTLLALASALYGKTPARAYLLTVGGECFELMEGLSPVVQQAVPEAVKQIEAFLVEVTRAKP